MGTWPAPTKSAGEGKLTGLSPLLAGGQSLWRGWFPLRGAAWFMYSSLQWLWRHRSARRQRKINCWWLSPREMAVKKHPQGQPTVSSRKCVTIFGTVLPSLWIYNAVAFGTIWISLYAHMSVGGWVLWETNKTVSDPINLWSRGNIHLVWSMHTHCGSKDEGILLFLRNGSFGDIDSLGIS